MKLIRKNEKISLYGNLNIIALDKNIEENIEICIESKEARKIGDVLYEILQKQYEKYNYDWENIRKKIQTTKLVINNETINSNYLVSIYGYVEDWGGIPTENGKKYDFCIKEIAIKDIFRELELLYDEYICDFDTIKDGLKFVIEKIEIKEEKIKNGKE